MQTTYFGGNLTNNSLAGIKCVGNEYSLSQCMHAKFHTGRCDSKDVAAVSCTNALGKHSENNILCSFATISCLILQ